MNKLRIKNNNKRNYLINIQVSHSSNMVFKLRNQSMITINIFKSCMANARTTRTALINISSILRNKCTHTNFAWFITFYIII